MNFLPGHSGRPKGAVNKLTDELSGKITEFLNDNFTTVASDFEGMKPGYRTRLYVDLLQFALPKLQSTNNKVRFEDMTDDQLQEIINGLKNNHG